MKKNRAPKNDSPFVRWLLGYVDRHEINLSALSQKAGLSSGSLRRKVCFLFILSVMKLKAEFQSTMN